MNLPWQSQLELVKAICVHVEVCRELQGILTAPCFGANQALGWIAEGSLAIWKKHHALPTEGLLRQWLQENTEGLVQASALERLPDVLEASITPANWAVGTGRRLAAATHLGALQSVLGGMADEGRFDEILTQVRRAAILASPGGEMTVGSGTEEQIRDRQTETGIRVPTGITQLDSLLGGGLKKGEMGHVLGKKGGGKSHTLVHLACEAVARELTVLYATLEMSEPEVRARVDRHLVGAAGQHFLTKLPQSMSRLQSAHGRLSVLTRKGLSVGSLVSAIERMDTKPDLVVVDYLQLLQTGGMDGQGEVQAMRRMALGRTSQELHDVAQEQGVALWTAYQANRIGITKMRGTIDGTGVLDVTDYAEAIDAAWPAAVIVSVNQSAVEAPQSTGRLFLAENRGGPSVRTVNCRLDWQTSTVRDA